MKSLQIAYQNKIFPIERLGDTLVVTPTGVLHGFSPNAVQTELKRVMRTLQELKLRNVVIDLHRSNYFGSNMLSVFLELKTCCPDGQVALCNVSGPMEYLLKLSQLEEAFPVYDSRRQAVSRIAEVNLRERMFRKSRFPIKQVAIALLIGGLWIGWQSKLIYQIIGSPVNSQYNVVLNLWEEYGSLQHANLTTEEKVQFRERAIKAMDRGTQNLSTRLPDDHGSEMLASAVSAFKDVLNDESIASKKGPSFLHYMHSTRNYLRRQTGLNVRPPSFHNSKASGKSGGGATLSNVHSLSTTTL